MMRRNPRTARRVRTDRCQLLLSVRTLRAVRGFRRVMLQTTIPKIAPGNSQNNNDLDHLSSLASLPEHTRTTQPIYPKHVRLPSINPTVALLLYRCTHWTTRGLQTHARSGLGHLPGETRFIGETQIGPTCGFSRHSMPYAFPHRRDHCRAQSEVHGFGRDKPPRRKKKSRASCIACWSTIMP